MRIVRLIRGLHWAAAWTLAVPVTMGFATAAIATAAMAPRSRLQIRLLRAWARTLLVLGGFRLRVEGLEHAPTDRQYVLMANHQSRLDIPALLAALPTSLDVRFLAKRSLFRVPFLGWAMRALGFVSVDREDGSTAPAMFAAARGQLERGRSVLVFPEATTALDDRLLPFRRGGFLLALKSRLPILPVGLTGTADGLPPGRLGFRPGPVAVRIGRPIDTRGRAVRDRDGLADAVRAEIERLRRGGGCGTRPGRG